MLAFKRFGIASLMPALVCFLMVLSFDLYAQSEKPGGEVSPETHEKIEEGSVRAYTLPPEKYQKAVEYARKRYTLFFISTVFGVALLAAIIFLRIAPRIRAFVEKISTVRFVQAAVFSSVLLSLIALAGLALDAYSHSLRVDYGLSVQSWGSWLWDWLKGQLLGLLLAVVLVWVLYGVIRKSPRAWWFYFWLAALPILIFVIFITPFFIDPLFFKFQPLQSTQPELVDNIAKVVERGGLSIPRERMYEMNASEKTKAVNAYVTGIGASKRVVVWDNTIQKMTVPQTLFVFGHEMGHYVLQHVWKTIGFIALLLLVSLYLGQAALHWALSKWGMKWQIHSAGDWASLPVLMLFFSVFSFLSAPIINSYSRAQEHNADVYGLEVIHGVVGGSQQVAAQSFQILGEINLSDPDPPAFIKIWLYSHPPLAERLEFAQEYNPWASGQKPKYVE